MVHQVNLFILLFGAMQGWLLSLWFLAKRKSDRANIFLAALLFVAGLQLTSKVISKVWLMENVLPFYLLSYTLPYTVGPLLFLFVRAKSGKTFSYYDLLHFVPIILGASFALDISFLQYWIHPYFHCGLQLASIATYHQLSWRIADRQVRTFVTVFVLAESVIIITLALMYVYYGRFPDVRLLFITLTALIYWISYRLISTTAERRIPNRKVADLQVVRTTKYAHSSLKLEEAQRIEQSLIAAMTDLRMYLDAKLTIENLAEKIGSNRHHLSQVLNERLGKTFYDFVNDYRLNEAQIRLTDPANYRFTIAAIAIDAGFTSVSTFNEAFKKKLGETPSSFRQRQMKKLTA